MLGSINVLRCVGKEKKVYHFGCFVHTVILMMTGRVSQTLFASWLWGCKPAGYYLRHDVAITTPLKEWGNSKNVAAFVDV